MTTATDVEAVLRPEIGCTESPASSNQNKFGAWYGWKTPAHSGPDHIGWVSRVDVADPDAFTAIEGNTAVGNDSNGGQVLERSRRNDRGYCLGFVRIPYTQAVPSGGPAPAWPGRSLALASPLMSGPDVTLWQARLHERGWRHATLGGTPRPFTADGVHGEVSDAVCRAFQLDRQLTVDGVVGPATWRATWASPVTPRRR
ncbi:peptidoglycan-binding protein [Frankia sp. QA3]|uniref:peptidoglycan-binding domain-containing protein n=1 Tax=Frankia sp. QA3 TaxID=710111 RepID=UPI000269BEE1|nr:peptidoglycan-binding domain-containing protein [Frankia sp. QA3]EIV92394.1 putative peptidoglycan-binding domain-containing protein [Frankia sp. QA3]